ncbi:unnamed protein product [Meloidogyne enterolobii]|uniref:Uncharacterized protein n=1 Tax=Meloidogyne enterolobii TaxID=390850 RepID=A0ACB0YRM7_MELEN
MFNEEEEEEEEEYEKNEENNNYRYLRRFWRIKRQFEQQNYIQTFNNNNNNQIPSISAIINLNGVPQQQTFPPPLPSSLSQQFLPTFPQYPQQQFIPQSPSDSQSIQMQLSNESTTDSSNNSFKNNNEFGRKKRKINKNHHQFQNSPIFKSPQQQQYPYIFPPLAKTKLC